MTLRFGAVVLAAGFGTRLGAAGESTPKGLLDMGGWPVLEPIARDLDAAPRVSSVVLVSNSRFAGAFRSWLQARDPGERWLVVDNGAERPEDLRGANRDLLLGLEHLGPGPTLVAASDNLYTFPVTGILDCVERAGRSAACVLEERDPARLQASGCAVLDDHGRIAQMVEKPHVPPSQFAVAPLYCYLEDALGLLPAYLSDGGNPDAPGYFCAWLAERVPLMAWRPPGRRVDVGSPQLLLRARELAAAGVFAQAHEPGGESPGA
jgi:glucose-1-phosphate thymidylyltransferase